MGHEPACRGQMRLWDRARVLCVRLRGCPRGRGSLARGGVAHLVLDPPVLVLPFLLAVLFCLAVSTSPALAAEPCPNEQLRAESAVNPATGQPYSKALPDCRAYELVTPSTGKNGSASLGVSAVSSNGEIVAYGAGSAFGESASNPVSDTYEAQRGASGWTTTARNPSSSALRGRRPLAPPLVSRDATKRLFEADVSPGEGREVLIGEPDGSLVDTVPLPTADNPKGASSDFGTLVVEETSKVYDQIVGVGGSTPRLYRLGIHENGEPIGECHTELGSFTSNFHAISGAGATVFLTVDGLKSGCEPAPAVNDVYAQINVTDAVNISEPPATDCADCETTTSAQRSAVFQGASADGSKVFFTTEQELLSGQSTENIYEYDFDNGAGNRIVLVSGGSTDPKVQGVVGISEDGSHVYFVAQGLLTSAKNGAGQEAKAGADNMYVFERDAAYPDGRTQFVGELCSGPEESGTVSDAGCPANLNTAHRGGSETAGAAAPHNDTSLWDGRDAERPAQITPNGEFLAFDSYASLTADKTSTAQAVYLYDAATGSVVRASTGQNGYDNNGNNNAYSATVKEGAHSGVEDPATDVSDDGTVSEDGSYVFFDSAEALTPQAVAGVEHVYEYHEGQVYLISDGQDEGGAVFEGATLSGSDVFLRSDEALVRQDASPNTPNIYDARIDGGFPPPVPATVPCSGEACQGAQSAAPTLASPLSAMFTGGENVTPSTATRPKPSATKPLTRAQRLSKALKVCRRDRSPKKRQACEKQAKQKYGEKASPKKKSAHGKEAK